MAAHSPTTPASLEVLAFRALCLGAAVLIPAFGYLFHAVDPAVMDPMWVRWSLAAGSVLLFGWSFVGTRRRGELALLTSVLVYLIVSWMVALVALNHLAPAYAVGLLFVLTTAGVASVGFHEVRATAVCLAFAVVSSVGVAFALPEPAVDPWIFSACVTANGLVIFLGAYLRLRTNAQLRASESRYRTVFDSTTDGVFLVDAESLHFLQANRAYLALVGYRLEELRALTLYDVLVIRADAIERDVRQVLAGHHLALGEQRHRRKDGAEISLEIGLNLFEHDGRAVLCFTAHDISEYKRIHAELEAAKEQAEEMLRLKSAFLNNMSHELRTPLVSILGFAELLAEELDAETQEIAETITRSARRLHETLNSVLDLAQLQGGEIRLKPEVVDVSEEARETLLLLGPMAEAKGLRLGFQPAEAAYAQVDAGALKRILTNLLSNAIKFTDEGGIGIEVEADSHRVFVRVHDTGIGMHEDFLPHLFEEFKQESMGIARVHEGNGLGLTITKRLVELMGGRIGVESVLGTGSTFTVAFARTSGVPEVPSAGPQPVTSRPREAAPALSARPRVLAVEDNADTRRLIERTLGAYYDVDTAADAESGLALARSHWYDIVMLDIHLDGGPGGLDVLHNLRGLSAYTYAPILAVTAYALPGDGERFVEAGFDAYLAKPFTRDELFWALEDVVAARAAPPG